MKGIEEFTKMLAERVQDRLPGVVVIPMDVVKNNGILAHGLMFRREDENVAPTLYLEEFFKKFKSNRLSAEDILEQIIRTYQELPEPDIPDMDEYLSSPNLLDNLTLRLLNLKKNQRMISERQLVHYIVPNTDLVVLVYIKVINAGGVFGEIALTETLMERYLPTFKEAKALYDTLVSKISADTVRLEPVTEMANRIIEEQGFDIPPLPVEANFLYVLTNFQKMFGAAVLLSEVGRRQILEKFPDGKITILPSSIHETLLLETKPEESVWWLKQMVKDVNRTQLNESEFLSDNVFHYDANTGELVIADTENDEVEDA